MRFLVLKSQNNNCLPYCSYKKYFYIKIVIFNIVLLLFQVFAIVVFGCISAGGYDKLHTDQCLFNERSDACHYGVGIGVIAFLGCIAFLAIEVQFDTINNPDTKKYIVLADIVFSALWCFLWFVGFCFLADMWRRQDKGSFLPWQVNNCQAAIAFSFFSIIAWVSSKYRFLWWIFVIKQSTWCSQHVDDISPSTKNFL